MALDVAAPTRHMSITAAYQGIEGSHSQVILQDHFKKRGAEVDLIGAPTFRDVAVAVATGKARYGLLPLDNAISGTFRDGYDLIVRYNLAPVREIARRLDQKLLAIEGATLAEIREIHGHPIALEECGRFLGTMIAATLIPAVDTGSAARMVAERKDKTLAVVGPSEAGELYGLKALATGLSDSRVHFTRFVLVEMVPEDQRTPPSGGSRRTSVLFRARNEPGTLAKCLTILSTAGINVSKVESRVRPGRPWEQSFYLDLDADLAMPEVFAALQEMRTHCTDFRPLGSYDADDEATASGNITITGEFQAPLTGEFQAPPTTTRLRTIESLSARPAAIHTTKTKSAVPPPQAAKNWPRASREQRPWGTTVKVDHVEIGGDDFIIMAGPCSVESKDQVMRTAEFVRDNGAVILRGGVFKPRTTPYAFQGLGWEGLELLSEAGRTYGLPIISEVMSLDQVERMARSVDILQIGARNMQNFDLLKAVGKVSKPIMLKRGLSATLDELLAAAEYILAEGNPDVILCERGIRTFENSTRNTLDLSAVPVLRERTHLPIIVDPSHGVGVRRWIRPLARAAKAVGAHGIIVEVHPDPTVAKSDADQALRFEQFADIVRDIRAMPDFD